MSDDLCLAHSRLVLPDRVIPGAETIEQGKISDLSEGEAVPTGALECGAKHEGGAIGETEWLGIMIASHTNPTAQCAHDRPNTTSPQRLKPGRQGRRMRQ